MADDLKLIVSTRERICMFDVTKPLEGWKSGHTFCGVTRVPSSLVLADNDDMCFTLDYCGYDSNFKAYDLSKDDALANPLYVLQLEKMPCDYYGDKMVGADCRSDGERHINSYLASLGNDGENSRICRVRSSSRRYGCNNYILIEVFAFEKGYIYK